MRFRAPVFLTPPQLPALIRRVWKLLLAALVCLRVCSAQTILLDSFNAGATTGAVRPGTSWVGQTTTSATALTVGGTARDENGWGATGLTLNAAGMNFVTVTAQRETGNAAGTFAIQFEDRNLNTQVFSVSMAAFAIGALTSVQIPIPAWAGSFAPTQITGWNIGGGGVGTTAFRMTFDHLALNAAATSGTVAPGATGNFGAQTKAVGESITFAITASGTAPLTYQWFKNATTALTANATSTTAALTLANLTPTDAGTYTCTVTNAAGSIVSGAFTLSVTAPAATVTLGSLAATYTGTPKSATGVTAPAGLGVVFTYNGSAVVPVNAGSYTVVATVNDPAYGGSATGTLVIAKAAQSIAFAPLPTTLRVGTAFNVTATATSGEPVALAVLAGPATVAGSTVTPTGAAPITLRATQAGTGNYLAATTDLAFTTTKQTQSIDFPAIADQPSTVTTLTLAATASSSLPVTFSVLSGPATLNGAVLTATGTGLVVVRASQPGSDTTNAAPDVTRSFNVSVAPVVTPPVITPPVTTPTARLGNLSARALAGAGERVTIAGFVITGDTPKPVLLRAIGPGLAAFGVPGTVAAPTLELFRSGTTAPLARNVGWSGGGSTDALVASAARVGAFALTPGSADSALIATLAPGTYSAVIGSADARIGVGLVEAYDLSAATPGQRINNLSIRAVAGSDADTLIVGLVVEGTTSQRYLVRAVGPGLTAFGVEGALARPQLAVFSGSNEIARNVGWSTSANATVLAETAAAAGAFPLAAGSADSALLLTLAPGPYTAQVSGLAGTTGVALVEVYEVR
jgi:hypothetical protein